LCAALNSFLRQGAGTLPALQAVWEKGFHDVQG
jgi:hypothetical protein